MGEDTVYVSSDIILQTLPSPGTGRMRWSHCVMYALYSLRICEQGCVCMRAQKCVSHKDRVKSVCMTRKRDRKRGKERVLIVFVAFQLHCVCL